jgi:starch synthase (maltosyl-transferring)
MATSGAPRRRDNLDSGERRRPAPAPGPALPLPAKWARPVIDHIRPLVDCGLRPARAAVGDLLRVEADAFADGHDALWCELRYRRDAGGRWATAPMEGIGNDRWRGTIPIADLGPHRFTVRAGIDRFATWSRDLKARAEAGQDLAAELLVGAELVEEASRRARAADRKLLSSVAELLRSAPRGLESELPEGTPKWAGGPALGDVFNSARFGQLMSSLADRRLGATAGPFSVVADPAKARCSAWYEMFPRSASVDPARPGTFADVRQTLDYVESMGFDVLYLPPIHPIGRTGRKGREGSVSAGVDDSGSPWAIGAAEGGHVAIHPELGTLEEFRLLVKEAAGRGIDVAIDLAFQASPDHPWVTAHPEWFRRLPDGAIRHAENPPKRYEDIYPLDLEGEAWPSLWTELREVVRFWIDQGITVFRVDNPHTKPFAFWEWLLASVKAEHPETIFLSEAFTRPRVMEQLAKVGFTQSYTYFAWRSTKWELETYLTELTRTDVADYFRPNFWPNTPDILTEELQQGGRAAFVSRLVLAATLSANYGIYGPAFELQEHRPRSRGSEEYLHSEKYEVRAWDRKDPRSLAGLISLVNAARKEHPALQFNDTLTFHGVDNEQVIAYSKTRPGSGESHFDDVVVVVVNLDHAYAQSGWVDLDLDALGVDPGLPYVMHDLLTDARFVWEGARNFVKLDPAGVACHLFSLEQDRPALSGTPNTARIT